MVFADFPRSLYLATLLVLSFLPHWLAYRLTQLLGSLRFRTTQFRYPREVGLLALYIANRLRVSDDLPTVWLRQCFQLIAQQDLEAWLLPRSTKSEIESRVQFVGIEKLGEALSEGRGTILFSGHAMSMVSMIMSLTLHGYNVTTIRAGQKERLPRSISELFMFYQFRALDRAGCQVLYSGGQEPFTATRSINALRRNGILVILVDSIVTSRGAVEVEFLNELAKWAPGAAALAASTGAAMLPLWSHRDLKSRKIIATIGAPLIPTKDLPAMVQEQAHRLETEILSDPPSWRRWLSQLQGMQRQGVKADVED